MLILSQSSILFNEKIIKFNNYFIIIKWTHVFINVYVLLNALYPHLNIPALETSNDNIYVILRLIK